MRRGVDVNTTVCYERVMMNLLGAVGVCLLAGVLLRKDP